MTKVAAKQLTGVEVHFISAVDRGAIREPFRIMKRFIKDEDTAMLDLGQGLKGLFRKTEVSAPALAVVAFSPDFPQDRAVAIMKNAGLEGVGEPSKTEDALLYPVGDYKDGDAIVLYQLSEDVAVGVRRSDAETVIKAFKGYEYESTDFKTVMGTNSAMPMMHVAMSALTDTVYNIMSNADTIEVAKSDVDKAVNDFSATLRAVLDTVPTTAFKLEAAVTKAGTVQKTEDAGQAGDTETKDDVKTEDDKTPVEKADDAKETPADADATDGDAGDDNKDETKVEKTDDKSMKDDEEKAGKAKTKKSEDGGEAGSEGEETGSTGDAVLEAIKAMKADLKADIASVKETQKEQGKAVEKVTKGLEETRKSLQKFDDELQLGLVGGDTDEDAGKSTTKKSEGSSEDEDEDGYAVIDTGYEDPFQRAGKAAD